MTVDYRVGDVRERMAEIPDGSISLVASSPPFLALRSYLPTGHDGKHLEIGSEPNPAAFIDTLLALTAEWGRVLAPWGSLAIELGDTYSGSGGAGGDYLPGGMRENAPNFTGSAKYARNGRHAPGGQPYADTFKGGGPGGTGWPAAKSLALIPQLYAVALAYGINPLTGAPSPAGRWLVRNVIVWHRPNPAVGALGDKFRPSTSYITVATRSPKRWFDLDAVRTPTDRFDLGGNGGRALAGGRSGGDERGGPHNSGSNHAGAPPLDAWFDEHDTITTQGSTPSTPTSPSTTVHPTSSTSSTDAPAPITSPASTSTTMPTTTPSSTFSSHYVSDGQTSTECPTAADGFDEHDTWTITTQPSRLAHYAMWPPKLAERLILSMCPEWVCGECGEPRRRVTRTVTKDRSAFDVQPLLAAHIKERREAAGYTSADLNGWFGYKEIAKNWERTDRHGAAIPNPDDWPLLKDRLGLSDEFDAVVMGERVWTVTDIDDPTEYVAPGGRMHDAIARDKTKNIVNGFGGHSGKLGPGSVRQTKTIGWSDCGHNAYVPGVVLDPFMGTGTSGAVAHLHGRDAIGIDLDPRNADLYPARLDECRRALFGTLPEMPGQLDLWETA